MKNRVVILAAIVAAACTDTTGTQGVTVADLRGTWNATAIQITNLLDTTLTEDLFALGRRWQMRVSDDGEASLGYTDEPIAMTGTMRVEGDSLVVENPDGVSRRTALHYMVRPGGLTVVWDGALPCIGLYGWPSTECPIPVRTRFDLRRQ